MTRGIKLFKIIGIRINLDYSWFVAFFLFAWSLGSSYYPQSVVGLSKSAYLIMGAISSLAIFICVLVHELAHSAVANRLGLNIKEITLFIFGGVAHLEEEPKKAMTEFWVAIAGPVASGLLALIFIGLKILLIVTMTRPSEAAIGIAVPGEISSIYPAIISILGLLARLTLMLLIFNLIPGFPLDGGRILRALWWAKSGDIKAATKIASSIGKSFALFLIIMGVLNLVSGNAIQGIWFLIIGLFLQQAADASYKAVINKITLAGIAVSEMMSKDVITLTEEQILSDVIEKVFFTHHFVSFPVVKNNAAVGLLTLNDVRAITKEDWAKTTVGEAMKRLTANMMFYPKDDAQDALHRMLRDDVGRYPVVDGSGHLVGIVSRRDIMKTMELKKTLSS
jgi:Zn-dependent protease